MFLGIGISGGEEGALKGPSIMPGGDEKAWELVRESYWPLPPKQETMNPAALISGREESHFVKTVHNGIEYGDIQLISEAYFLMRELLGISAAEIGEVFQSWNQGVGILFD